LFTIRFVPDDKTVSYLTPAGRHSRKTKAYIDVAAHNFFHISIFLNIDDPNYKFAEQMQGYSKVPPELPNSTAQQPRKTGQEGAYQ